MPVCGLGDSVVISSASISDKSGEAKDTELSGERMSGGCFRGPPRVLQVKKPVLLGATVSLFSKDRNNSIYFHCVFSDL